jgi:hypothetical protein
MAYRIQHLGLGDVLDQAIAIVKDHFGLLFKIMLCLLIPVQLASNLLALATMPKLPPGASPDEYAEILRHQAPVMAIVGSLGLLQLFFVIPLTNAAVIHAVARLYLDEQVTAREAFRHAISRLAPIVGTSVLKFFAVVGGFFLCIFPMFVFLLWFGLSQHVVVIEGLSGPRALGRSKQLVQPNFFTFLILGLLVFSIGFSISFSARFIPQVYLQGVTAILVNAVITIFVTTVFVVFYFSCRCGVENFDLEYLAQSIGRDDPEGEPVLVPVT